MWDTKGESFFGRWFMCLFIESKLSRGEGRLASELWWQDDWKAGECIQTIEWVELENKLMLLYLQQEREHQLCLVLGVCFRKYLLLEQHLLSAVRVFWEGKGLSVHSKHTLGNKQPSGLLCFSKCRSCWRCWTKEHQPSWNRMKGQAKACGQKGLL